MTYQNQIMFLLLILLLLTLELLFILKKFKRSDLFPYLLFPLLIFVIGFCLRLSNNQEKVDLGFYLTEVSYIFLTMLFVLALFLGQLKYWKK